MASNETDIEKFNRFYMHIAGFRVRADDLAKELVWRNATSVPDKDAEAFIALVWEDYRNRAR